MYNVCRSLAKAISLRDDLFAPLVLSPALIERRSVSDHVLASLRDAIRSGALPDGTELNQMSLAAHYGISRVPIREALMQLQAEGWITARHHHRAVVRGISSDRIAEMIELRLTLECTLLEYAVPRMTAASIARLDAVCNEMEQCTDHDAWLRANSAFHHVLYEVANRPATLEMLEQISSQVERYIRSKGSTLAREREALAEHRAIVDAVRAGSIAQTQELMRGHIGHTLARFREESTTMLDRRIDAAS